MHKVPSLLQSYNLIKRESCYSLKFLAQGENQTESGVYEFCVYLTYFTLADQRVRKTFFADLNSVLIRSIPASRVLS